MGNFIFGYNFVDYTPSASGEDTGYPVVNIKDYAHPKRQWHVTPTTIEHWIQCDFGSAKAVQAVMLNDINFTSLYIEGSSDASNWTFSQQFTASKDERTQRYKLYAALSGFNYQYLRVRIPAQAPTDNASYFRVGTLVCLDTAVELTQNPTYPYEYSADEPMATNEFLSGGFEDVNLGDLAWQGSFSFDTTYRTQESEFWTLNSLKKDAFLVFYENLGNTSKCYLCKRRTAIEVSWKKSNQNQIRTITLREIL